MPRRATSTVRAAAAAAILLLTGTAASCSDDSTAACGSGTCNLNLKLGGSTTLGGQKLTVTHLDHDSVTLTSHGVSFHLHRGLKLDLGRYHLRLTSTQGSSAHLSVDD